MDNTIKEDVSLADSDNEERKRKSSAVGSLVDNTSKLSVAVIEITETTLQNEEHSLTSTDGNRYSSGLPVFGPSG